MMETRSLGGSLHSASDGIFSNKSIYRSLQAIKNEIRVEVDLDKEENRPARPGKSNLHRVFIRLTTEINFSALSAWLARTADFDNACFNAMSFLDHLIRERPSQTLVQLKKSFFEKLELKSIKADDERGNLGKYAKSSKGVFASLRPVLQKNGPGLSVTVDVANGTFWASKNLVTTAMDLCGVQDSRRLGTFLIQPAQKFRMLQNLKKLKRVAVTVSYATLKRPGALFSRQFIVARVLESDAKAYKFQRFETDENTGERVEKGFISIFDYFYQLTGRVLDHPHLPVVEMTRKGNVFPMEYCRINPNQRYAFKLDEMQTSAMIKEAVTPPSQRWRSISAGIGMLDWQNDPYMKKYGLQISAARTVVEARLLQTPKIRFGDVEIQPSPAYGKWDLKQKQFLRANPEPLKSWGICILTSTVHGREACDKYTAQHFAREFTKIYTGHGGTISREPLIQIANMARGGELITDIWRETGNRAGAKPQIIFFVVPDKDSALYTRIKRSCDCRYGFQSQVVQGKAVQECKPQYISNVCMKVNAKLGGITAEAKGLTNSIFPKGGTKRVMCIGADVSHAAPGSESASMAAITVSLDRACTKYAALCETNGHRLEIITTDNINTLLPPMVNRWRETVGAGQVPDEVLYFRDGVSEGQYRHVLDQELRDLKAYFKSINPGKLPKFLVIIASKRHHIRFFPPQGQGDRNGNPIPGTLVERGVTHPFEFDFYLCSHAAIKGTARPIHYHVIHNETQISPSNLQQVIYEHSYQYIRSTTPVSMFPAVYYAHLASNRAKTHEDPAPPTSSSKEKKGAGASKGKSTVASTEKQEPEEKEGEHSSSASSSDVKKLIPMINGMQTSFWFV